MEQKQELDALIIKVSKEMRARDYDMRDLNYQAALDKEGVLKENEMLKRQLQGEKQGKEGLEMIEGDLIHKLQVRESELTNLKGHTLPALK